MVIVIENLHKIRKQFAREMKKQRSYKWISESAERERERRTLEQGRETIAQEALEIVCISHTEVFPFLFHGALGLWVGTF